jgi:hypothetical protein
MSSGRASASWLGGSDREARNRRYQELPESLRRRFWQEVALRRRGLGETKAREAAWQLVLRLDAIARRWGDSKACERCGARVLWRREGAKPVPVDVNGHVHACG